MSGQSIPPFPQIDGVEFRHISGYPGYAVSDDGHAWSCKTPGRHGILGVWRMMPEYPVGSRTFHYTIFLWQHNIGKQRFVHHLVLEEFCGPCPSGMEACHNDGKAENNRRENLRWDTPKNNNADKRLHGTSNEGEKNPQAKLTAALVDHIRHAVANGEPQTSIAHRLHIRQSAVSRISIGKRWGNVASVQTTPNPNRGPAAGKGEKNWTAKMTPEKVQEIRKLAKEEADTVRLSEMFGIGRSQIRNIITRKHWKHVP